MTDLPPLGGVIDPDGLRTLVNEDAVTDGFIEFSYAGYQVTLTAEGDVDVRSEEA